MQSAHSALRSKYQNVRLEGEYVRVYDVNEPEEIVDFLLRGGHALCEVKKNRVGLEEYYVELMRGESEK